MKPKHLLFIGALVIINMVSGVPRPKDVSAPAAVVRSAAVAHSPPAKAAVVPHPPSAVSNAKSSTTSTIKNKQPSAKSSIPTAIETKSETKPQITAKVCKEDAQIRSWDIFHNTRSGVYALLEHVLTETFSAINTTYPIQEIINNCGGKCMLMVVMSLESTMTAADSNLQECIVRDAICKSRTTATAVTTINTFSPKINECLKSFDILISTDKWNNVQNLFKSTITVAIDKDMQLLNSGGELPQIPVSNAGTPVVKNPANAAKMQPAHSSGRASTG